MLIIFFISFNECWWAQIFWHSNDWDLSVNVDDKKKCNLSKYGGKIKSSKKGNLNGHLMEIVDEWVYLGGGK